MVGGKAVGGKAAVRPANATALPPYRLTAHRLAGYIWITRGRLASTGMKTKLQRAQVQSPGKTVWNVSTANTELALAA